MPTRKSIFETNSSSTHSVVISDSTDFITPEFNDKVEIFPGEYEWEVEEYHDWKDKASYALTYAKSYGKTDDADVLLKVLEDHLRTRVEFVSSGWEYYSWGYIDHQSIDEAALIFKSPETVKKFIFGKESYFKTDNDNH
jgi:hypothetical protein